MGNERNVSEDELILSSIDESSTDNDYNGGFISKNTLKEICHENHIHPDNNAIYDRLKIHYHIKK